MPSERIPFKSAILNNIFCISWYNFSLSLHISIIKIYKALCNLLRNSLFFVRCKNLSWRTRNFEEALLENTLLPSCNFCLLYFHHYWRHTSLFINLVVNIISLLYFMFSINCNFQNSQRLSQRIKKKKNETTVFFSFFIYFTKIYKKGWTKGGKATVRSKRGENSSGSSDERRFSVLLRQASNLISFF